MNDVERALLNACHHALIMMRDRAYTKAVTPEEVAGVTDALELVIIELWSGRATGNHLLLESVLADISRKFEGYGGAALFALDPAGELARQRAIFEQLLVDFFGPLPVWAQERICQADGDDLERYRDQYAEVWKEQALTKRLGGIEAVFRR